MNKGKSKQRDKRESTQNECTKASSKGTAENSFIDMRKLKWVFFYFIYIYMYMVEGHIEAVLSEFNICRHFQM